MIGKPEVGRFSFFFFFVFPSSPLASMEVLNIGNAFSISCWDVFHFLLSVAAAVDNELIVMLEKQQMQMDEMPGLNPLHVCVCIHERRWVQTWAYEVLSLYLSVIALIWSRTWDRVRSSPHNLRRVLPTLACLWDVWWPFQCRLGLAGPSCVVAAAQPWMCRRGSEGPEDFVLRTGKKKKI